MTETNTPPSIAVSFLPMKQMRYETLDDYTLVDDVLLIDIADTGDARSNYSLLIHAIVEYQVATLAGVTIGQIDDWDFLHPNSDEPGEDPKCPYHAAHMAAMEAEKSAVSALGLTWAEHEQNLKRTIDG